LLTEVQETSSAEPLEIAAALAQLLQGDEPLLLEEKPEPPRRNKADRQTRGSDEHPPRRRKDSGGDRALSLKGHPEVEMQRFRLAVGYQHDVKHGNIVGAIANEAEIDSEYIGHIEIYEHYSTVDLPAGMPRETFMALKKARVCQQRLDIRPAGEPDPKERKPLSFKARKKTRDKHAGNKLAKKFAAKKKSKKKPAKKRAKRTAD